VFGVLIVHFCDFAFVQAEEDLKGLKGLVHCSLDISPIQSSFLSAYFYPIFGYFYFKSTKKQGAVDRPLPRRWRVTNPLSRWKRIQRDAIDNFSEVSFHNRLAEEQLLGNGCKTHQVNHEECFYPYSITASVNSMPCILVKYSR
jgi:hypothetical protein